MKIDPSALGLALAVSTAWATIFLGVLSTQTLRLDAFAREVLKAAGAWMVAGLLVPRAICHWYFIFALICLVSWLKLKRDHALSGKIWLSVASGLGISLGTIFLLQTAPGFYAAGRSPRDVLLTLASLYLGGATAGLAYVNFVRLRNHGLALPASLPGMAKGLVALALAWAAVAGVEAIRPGLALAWPQETRAVGPLLVVIVLAFAASHAARSGALIRAKLLFAIIAAGALATNLAARWLGL